MINLNRPGRYTGPSLQAGVEVVPTGCTEGKSSYHIPLKVAPTRCTPSQKANNHNFYGMRELRLNGGIMDKVDWLSSGKKKGRILPNGAREYQFDETDIPARISTWFESNPDASCCITIVQQGAYIA